MVNKKVEKVFVICLTLAESGFLSNPEEALKLADEAYQNQIAEAVTEGVLSYLTSKK